MADYIIQDTTLTAIADAIREKIGETAALTPATMATAIAGIETGGASSDIEAQWIAVIEGGGEVTKIPGGVTSIRNCAFYGCTNLALTSLPDGLTSIDNSAFYECTNLALTSLPDGLKSIGTYAFYKCTSLALTSLPDGILDIGTFAFYKCTNLTEITFEGTPTTINSSAFNQCANLLTINVPWSEGAVANAPWGATNATINYNYTGG